MRQERRLTGCGMAIRKAGLQWRRGLWQGGIDAERPHAQRCLKEVVVALCLCLGLDPVLAPHIQTVPPD